MYFRKCSIIGIYTNTIYLIPHKSGGHVSTLCLWVWNLTLMCFNSLRCKWVGLPCQHCKTQMCDKILSVVAFAESECSPGSWDGKWNHQVKNAIISVLYFCEIVRSVVSPWWADWYQHEFPSLYPHAHSHRYENGPLQRVNIIAQKARRLSCFHVLYTAHKKKKEERGGRRDKT